MSDEKREWKVLVVPVSLGPCEACRSTERYPAINAPGSVVRSGANSQAYLDGWDRIFASRRHDEGVLN